jgi:hypothetical protein
VATRHDIEGLRTATRSDIAPARQEIGEVKHDLQIAVRDMTTRVGAMLIVLGGFLASIKFFG